MDAKQPFSSGSSKDPNPWNKTHSLPFSINYQTLCMYASIVSQEKIIPYSEVSVTLSLIRTALKSGERKQNFQHYKSQAENSPYMPGQAAPSQALVLDCCGGHYWGGGL